MRVLAELVTIAGGLILIGGFVARQMIRRRRDATPPDTLSLRDFVDRGAHVDAEGMTRPGPPAADTFSQRLRRRARRIQGR